MDTPSFSTTSTVVWWTPSQTVSVSTIPPNWISTTSTASISSIPAGWTSDVTSSWISSIRTDRTSSITASAIPIPSPPTEATSSAVPATCQATQHESYIPTVAVAGAASGALLCGIAIGVVMACHVATKKKRRRRGEKSGDSDAVDRPPPPHNKHPTHPYAELSAEPYAKCLSDSYPESKSNTDVSLTPTLTPEKSYTGSNSSTDVSVVAAPFPVKPYSSAQQPYDTPLTSPIKPCFATLIQCDSPPTRPCTAPQRQPFPPPRRPSVPELGRFLLDPSPEQELRSELESISVSIASHVEGSYHLEPVEVDEEQLVRTLGILGLGGPGFTSASVIAARALDPKTRHVALQHVISHVVFMGVDLNSRRRPLSLLPPAFGNFINSVVTDEFTSGENGEFCSMIKMQYWNIVY